MSKANFDHIYTAPDPRPYFQTLDGLDYQIPAHGASLFSAVAEHVAEVRDRDTVRIADLCCSYGINAAVMKHEPTFDEIVAHYTTDDCQALDRDDLLARDHAFFEERLNSPALEVVGIDVSSEAVGYAVEAGILDGGAAEDLETRDPSPRLAGLLERTDLVTVTGGIGYITERTVGRVLDAVPTTPWIAALCLRWVDFDGVAEAGRARDMVVHRLDDVTFPQRRFADVEEQQHVLNELDRIGVDPTGREADGYHHAELFVLHPADEQLMTPLHELVGTTVAVNR
jgi:hypothetical protein